MTALTIAKDVRLDLGHTDLVGTLTYDGEGLVLVTPSGSTQLLGSDLYPSASGEVRQAPLGCVLIGEMGLHRLLPAALVAQGLCKETARHRGISAWGVDVIELEVLLPDMNDGCRDAVSASPIDLTA
jgi:hypothetical protein